MIGSFVYFFYDSEKNLLYVGKTIGLENRMRQHFSKDTVELDPWKNLVDKKYILLYPCNNPTDLDIYETYFINKYKPIYNKDKVFNHEPTILLTPIEPIIYSIEVRSRRDRAKGGFRDNCITYIEYPEERLNIAVMLPVIEKAYNILGADRMKALSYHLLRIEAELKANSEDTLNKIRIGLMSELELDKEYLASDIKDLLNTVYKKLDLDKRAKATDINDYFELEKRQKRFEGILKHIVILQKVR